VRIALFATVAALTLTTPAFAVTCFAGNTAELASAGDISPTALACEGRFDKNVLDNTTADLLIQKNALHDLGLEWDSSTFSSMTKLSSIPSGQHTIDFGTMLYGITYIGFHAGGKGGGSTSFYKFDAGTGMSSFTWVDTDKYPSSGAILYSTGAPTNGVPEPASWALMLGGFGMVGGALRGSRKTAVRFA
jgi:hypothetical protein